MKASASRRSGGGLNENFTVRKISYGEGVERVFPLYAPMIDSIKVVRRGKVRRAKLYYLRGLRGKSARIAEAQGRHGGSAAGAPRKPRSKPARPSLIESKGRLRPAFFVRYRRIRLHCGFSLELLYRGHELDADPSRHFAFVLRDHDRLPGRFFGRMTAAIQAGL